MDIGKKVKTVTVPEPILMPQWTPAIPMPEFAPVPEREMVPARRK